MKTYGIILAENASAMYISGVPDSRWDNSGLHSLGQIAASDFDVVQLSPLYTNSNLPSGPSPTISSFTANSTSVSSGSSVTLSWQVTGASYVIISPTIGATCSTFASVSPTSTTTYTLYAANAYGQTTSSVSVTVP